MEPCFKGAGTSKQYAYRWKGRIRAVDGRLEHVVDACLDTCAGRFQGKLVTRLTRTAKGWRSSSDTGSIGDSGWELRDVRWDWEPKSWDFGPRAGAGSDIDIVPVEKGA